MHERYRYQSLIAPLKPLSHDSLGSEEARESVIVLNSYQAPQPRIFEDVEVNCLRSLADHGGSTCEKSELAQAEEREDDRGGAAAKSFFNEHTTSTLIDSQRIGDLDQ